jgi:hypothetical protein
MRQERAEKSYDLCRIPSGVPEELWKKWLGKPCMPASPAYDMTPEVDDAEAFGEPKRVEWLLTAQETLEELQKKVIDMEDGCQQLDRKGRNGTCLCHTCSEGDFTGPWLDEQTQRVEIAFVTYNAEYGLLSLTSVSFFFNRGGKIHKFAHVQSSWADHFAGAFFDVVPMLLCDAIWLFLLGYVFVSEVKEIIRIVRASKDYFWRAIREDYLGMWNIVDWISMALAFFCAQMFVQIFIETAKVIPEFERIAALDINTVGQEEYIRMSQNFFTMIESLCGVERWYRMSFCFYPMAVMLRLFKSFAAQGRLAVVTRTLSDAANDMIHFFIVFFSVYFCMVVNSVLIFGQDIEDYTDLSRATITCFRNMFGDWDWGGMEEGTQWVSASWFWMFVMMMVGILLNFLLAILMDSYAVVKERSMDEQTLIKQVDTMMRRRSQNKAGERVKLGYIFDTYFKDYMDEKKLLAEKTIVTPDDVMKKVKGIPRSQATRTVMTAKEKYAVPEPEYGPTEVKKDLDRINTRTSELNKSIENVRAKFQRHDNSTDFDHKTTTKDVEKSAPPRQQMQNAVRQEVEMLSFDVSNVMEEELEVLVEQHQELDTQTGNVLTTMRETRNIMSEMIAATESAKKCFPEAGHLQKKG